MCEIDGWVLGGVGAGEDAVRRCCLARMTAGYKRHPVWVRAGNI